MNEDLETLIIIAIELAVAVIAGIILYHWSIGGI